MRDPLFTEEAEYEIATIRSSNREFDIVLVVNPVPSERPCFKMYDNKSRWKAARVAKISFFEPKQLKYAPDYLNWSVLTEEDKIKLIDYLNSPASIQDESVWNTLKYHWNNEAGADISSFKDYLNGSDDEINASNPYYVPSTLEMPDYMQL